MKIKTVNQTENKTKRLRYSENISVFFPFAFMRYLWRGLRSLFQIPKNDRKTNTRGLGREEAILPFPPPPMSPDHARLVFAGLVFATSVLSESLTEARSS